jgi:hypothetical protein
MIPTEWTDGLKTRQCLFYDFMAATRAEDMTCEIERFMTRVKKIPTSSKD